MRQLIVIVLMTACSVCNAAWPDESAIWRGNNIPVCVEYTVTPDQVATIRASLARTWEAFSMVRFHGWHGCTDEFIGVRITTEDSNPRTVFLGHSEHMTWFKQPNLYLNFTFKRWYPECPKIYTRKTCEDTQIPHEFGHILGWAHDQNQDDPKKPAWCKKDQYPAYGTTAFLSYDEHSVMNYCNPVWAGLGNLSMGDILTAQAYYGNLPSLESSTGILTITDASGYTATMQDIGVGEYKVIRADKCSDKSIVPQVIEGDKLTLPLGKLLEQGSVKGLYRSSMQRLSNGNWVFTSTERLDI